MNASIPRFAAVLGVAGLLPFLGATGAMFATDPGVSGFALYVLSAYATVILAFLGAVHWGIAIAHEHPRGRWQLALGVLPALLAWLALVSLPPRGALIAFGFLFLILLGADLLAMRLELAPRWYARMRVPLTVIVCAALWTAAWKLGR